MNLTRELAYTLNGAGHAVVIYSDLSTFRYWDRDRDTTVAGHYRSLLDALGKRTVLFPTFNYDWCQTARFDIEYDPSQLGVLSEHARRSCHARTMTPIFNFVIPVSHDVAPSLAPVHDPFVAARSTFRWLIEQKATVVAYGCRLRYASACHVAECQVRVPYRYYKAFHGDIAGFGPWVLDYHVRHPQVTYDWDAVDEIIEPCFTDHEVCGARVRLGRADEINAAIVDALRADEHALVQEPKALYARYGKPLAWENVG